MTSVPMQICARFREKMINKNTRLTRREPTRPDIIFRECKRRGRARRVYKICPSFLILTRSVHDVSILLFHYYRALNNNRLTRRQRIGLSGSWRILHSRRAESNRVKSKRAVLTNIPHATVFSFFSHVFRTFLRDLAQLCRQASENMRSSVPTTLVRSNKVSPDISLMQFCTYFRRLPVPFPLSLRIYLSKYLYVLRVKTRSRFRRREDRETRKTNYHCV